jgi:hypothetical protein
MADRLLLKNKLFDVTSINSCFSLLPGANRWGLKSPTSGGEFFSYLRHGLRICTWFLFGCFVISLIGHFVIH